MFPYNMSLAWSLGWKAYESKHESYDDYYMRKDVNEQLLK